MKQLQFTPDVDSSSNKWWAIDEDNVEFCIYPMSDIGWDSEMWSCIAQKQIAWDEVKHALGTYETFEEAVAVCEEYDTSELINHFR